MEGNQQIFIVGEGNSQQNAKPQLTASQRIDIVIFYMETVNTLTTLKRWELTNAYCIQKFGRHISRSSLMDLINKFKNTGSVANLKHKRNRSVRTPLNISRIENEVIQNPK